MSVSVQSPFQTFPFDSIDSLSPPPTPGKKRVCLSKKDIPAFLPESGSLLGPQRNEGPLDFPALPNMAMSAPPMRRSLKPRPMFGTKMEHRDGNDQEQRPQFSISGLPPLPFAFPTSEPVETQTEAVARQMPVLPLSFGDTPKSSPRTSPMSAKPSPSTPPKASSAGTTPTKQGAGKLPAFQRKGMFHNQKRNSLVARCA